VVSAIVIVAVGGVLGTSGGLQARFYNQMPESDKQDLMNFLRCLLAARPRGSRRASQPARLETR
jgi:hypothetical protein